ncbi:MAG: bacteriohopanetetrol glucosamine biosynthesis glycosyltransferase HpnI [Burkholderiaceae bacterium]
MSTLLVQGFTLIGIVLLGISACGSLYVIVSVLVFARFFAGRSDDCRPRGEAVTLLKPLCGAEPRLESNLSSFVAQAHDGPVQLICGVHGGDEPAIAAVAALRAAWPERDIAMITCPTAIGTSGKISNLASMNEVAVHPIVVISDSDIVASPDYLTRVITALDGPGVGAVSLLYDGRSDGGFWSSLSAAGISYQFLPGAVFGVSSGLAEPCMGSTIAMSRSTLDRIGGFERFVDVLADDYAIGESIRQLDLDVVVPPYLVTHACAEQTFMDLWRHEIRWGVTLRSLVPGAYAASVIGMPLPLAILGAACLPSHLLATALIAIAWMARIVLARTVDRQVGRNAAPLWLLPARDCLTLAVFVASFFVRSVEWRGQRFRMETEGRMSADNGVVA